jgi:outer membrane lipoprotein-sorting protein
MRGLLTGLLVLALGTGAAAEEDVAAVLACMRQNAPKTALVQTVQLLAVDRAGGKREETAKLFAKRSPDGRGRVLLRVEDPPDLRGSAFLLIQKEKGSDMFVYLPEMKKVRRISKRHLSGKLFGTDFSYEDAERLYGAGREGELKRLADAERDGRPVYVLEAAPGEGSDYERVVSSVDRETCVPLEVIFYAKGKERKVLSVDPTRITKEGEVHVPRLVTMRDLERGTESRITTLDVSVDPDLKDSTFSAAALELSR